MQHNERQNHSSDRYSRDPYDRDRDRYDDGPEGTYRPVDEQFSRYQSRYASNRQYNSGQRSNDPYYDQRERSRDPRHYEGMQRYERDNSRFPQQYEEFAEFQNSGNRRENSHKGKGPKNYKRSDDRIKEDICDRLSDDHDVDASDITVNVEDGEVQLKGNVDNRETKRNAEDCCHSVSGVTDVMNQLRINASNVHRLSERSDHKSGDQRQKKKQASK